MSRMAVVACFLLMLAMLPTGGDGGIVGLAVYGACQTGCNAAAVACWGAAGFTFGVSTFGAAVPAAIVACTAAQGTCMAACAAMALSPV